MSRLYFALIFVFATVVASSVADEPKFEPGELLVGYVTSGDRDAALKRLAGAKDILRVRGEQLVNVEIQPVADKSVKLHLTFPAPVLSVTQNNPSEEIAVLQDVAKQIKDADHSVEYAHPNWIAKAKISSQSEKPVLQAAHVSQSEKRVTQAARSLQSAKPVEQASLQSKKPVPQTSHHVRRHIAKTHRLASHRRHHATVVAWHRRHHRVTERRWSYGYSWPFSFSSHCRSETWMHAQRHRAFSKHPRSATR
jgi:hypothetical protein